jgi:hypothetical protein
MEPTHLAHSISPSIYCFFSSFLLGRIPAHLATEPVSGWHPPGSGPGLAPPYPHPALLLAPATRPHTRRRVQISTIPVPHRVFETRWVPAREEDKCGSR